MLNINDTVSALKSSGSFSDILKSAGIEEMVTVSVAGDRAGLKTILKRNEHSFFVVVHPDPLYIVRFAELWESFKKLDPKVKDAVIDGLIDGDRKVKFGLIREIEGSLDSYIEERSGEIAEITSIDVAFETAISRRHTAVLKQSINE